MNKYVFHAANPERVPGIENDQIVSARTLDEAVRKFCRKNELEAPAYWDEPFFERHIELQFKTKKQAYRYHISW